MSKKLSLSTLALALMCGAAPAMAAEPAPAATPAAPAVTTPAPMPAPAAIPATAAVPAKPGRAQMEAEKRLADLHGKLKITADEQKYWDDFAATMRQNAAATDALMEQHKEQGDVTALVSMQNYAQFTQNMADNIQRLLPKFEALYNVLTPEQKKAADDAFNRARAHMMKNGHPG